MKLSIRLALAYSAVIAFANPAMAANPPGAGDTWAYRVINAYNGETRGSVQFRVEKVDADRIAVAMSADPVSLGTPRTEIYTADGRWLRHTLTSHDQPVEYEFAQPYPAYDFPLDNGKSWSTRVQATNPANGRRARIRVDGDVLGTERVTVPAGAFDTIKIRRRIYGGDFEGSRSETNIVETEWYAPALQRAVKLERNSGYMDQARCTDEMSACTPVRGDWLVFELVQSSAK